ncbi:uncharacterized protein LOC118825549 [Colossoma macropomum]|uniref:uncharacterized protein LOC118825549 n=1 Tax=Colossoma macropomum TaxID=42526 RepID=UPI001863CB7D|nr:uncharacterized protein LOC118825549 [Colossoma macropomum]
MGASATGGGKEEARKWREGAPRPPPVFRKQVHRPARAVCNDPIQRQQDGSHGEDREEVSPVPGLTLSEAKQVWKNAAHPALQNKHKDLCWLAAHEILPVRAVMHSRGMGTNPICPRPGCGEPETVRHALWECSVARDLWGMIGPLQCPSLPAGAVHPLVYRLAVNGVGQGTEKLPAEEFTALWLTLNSVKAALWTARNLLVGKRVTVPLHAIYELVTSSLQGAPSAAIRRRGPGPHAGGSRPPRSLAPVDAPPKRM